MPTPDYRPPTSAEELLERYARGERFFARADIAPVHLSPRDWYRPRPNLSGAKLAGSHLADAVLTDVDLSSADLSAAQLTRAKLDRSDLTGAHLKAAHLRGASLSFAVLANARLRSADLSDAWLTNTRLDRANLIGTVLVNARLSEATLQGAHLGATVFAKADLAKARGLETAIHHGPSFVDAETLLRSKDLPLEFLRGVGLADWQVEEAKLLQPDLTPTEISDIMSRVVELRGAYPLQVRPVFISYTHADTEFVDILEAELNAVGIRFWRDIHDIEAGPLEPQVHRAMEDRVAVIVLSNASTKSDWVEHEVKHARELAKTQGHYTLCPIALDDSWRRCVWPERLREQLMEYAILDFSGWQDRKRMAEMFVRLERGLRKWYR